MTNSLRNALSSWKYYVLGNDRQSSTLFPIKWLSLLKIWFRGLLHHRWWLLLRPRCSFIHLFKWGHAEFGLENKERKYTKYRYVSSQPWAGICAQISVSRNKLDFRLITGSNYTIPYLIWVALLCPLLLGALEALCDQITTPNIKLPDALTLVITSKYRIECGDR